MMVNTRIAVVGDGMLDILRFGSVTRMSPEDPNCPVFDEVGRRLELGGAANVARWLAAQPQTHVVLFSHHCGDPAGEWFRTLCRDERIELRDYLFWAGEQFQTTVKERLIQGSPKFRHIVRADRETQCRLTEDEFCLITEELIRGGFDAVVVADYQKSIFVGSYGDKLREEIGSAVSTGTSSCQVPDPNALYVVNSKKPGLWAGNAVDFLICNRQEAESSWPNESISQILWQVLAGQLVITRGADGLDAVRHSNETIGVTCWQMQTLAKRVVDVTGAGDAFTAGVVHGLLKEQSNERRFQLEDNSVEAALQHGLEWAALCCEQEGCGNPSLLSLSSFMDKR